MPRLPEGVQPAPPKSPTVAQLVARLDLLAARLRAEAQEIEDLSWQLTLHGVRPSPRNRKNDDEIPF